MNRARAFSVVVLVTVAGGCNNEAPPKPTTPVAITTPVAPTSSIAPVSSSVTVDAGAADAGTSPDRVLAVLDEVGPSKEWSRSPEDTRRLFDDARQNATPAEKTFVDHAEKVAAEIAAAREGKPALERQLLAYVALLREAAALRPDDPETQVRTASTFRTAANFAVSWSIGDVARDMGWRREAIERAEVNVRRFPSFALAHLSRAEIASPTDEDQVVALRHLAKCLELAPQNRFCTSTYAKRAKAYVEPRCNAKAVRPALGLFVGTKKSRPDARTMDTPLGPLYVDKKATFGALDLESAQGDGESTTVSGKGGMFQLRSDRWLAFGKWLEKVTQKDDGVILVVLDGTKWVASEEMRSSGAPEEGAIWFSYVYGPLCTKSERPSLPTGLPAP